jgi:hypothetical protein
MLESCHRTDLPGDVINLSLESSNSPRAKYMTSEGSSVLTVPPTIMIPLGILAVL